MLESNKRYIYFVSYRFSTGFGRCEVKRNQPIESIEDIAKEEYSIQQQNSDKDIQIIITNFQLLRTEDI